MQGRTNAGGTGGFGLNLKVVNGATMPSNPRENTVWVNTTTPITSYAFAYTQPETVSEGLLWIKTSNLDTGVEVDVGKKNAVKLNLTYGALYTNSEWKNVECFVFYNGEWRQFSYLRTYLYNAGSQCEALTGGWAITNHSGGTSKLLDDYIQVSNNGGSNRISNIHTKSKVNLNGYSKLCAQLEVSEASSSFGITFGLGSSTGLDSGKMTVSTFIGKPSDGPTIVSVDISSAASNYVIFYARSSTAKITAVWFER